MEIVVSSNEFQTFLSAISLVDRNGASFEIHKNYIDSFVKTEDNSSLILWLRLNILEPEKTGLDEEAKQTIFIKDISKFQKLLDMNGGDTFTFSLVNSEIRYHGNIVKSAKFSIKKDVKQNGMLMNFNPKIFDTFKILFSSTVSKREFKRLIQAASFCDVNDVKAYFQVRDNVFVGELDDKSKIGTDSLVLTLSEKYDGELETSVVTVNILSKIKVGENITIEATNVSGNGRALIVTIVEENVMLKYLLASRKK